MSTSARRAKRFSQRMRDRGTRRGELAPAQHARVVGAADGDPRRVEMLEQRLGVAARGAELVAQAGERDRALARRRSPRRDRARRRSRRGARSGRGRARTTRPASRSARRSPRVPSSARAAARARRRAGAPRARAPPGDDGAARGGRRRGARLRRAGRCRASRSRAAVARGRGSTTTPPPSVSGGAIERTTTRSPARDEQRALQAQLPPPAASDRRAAPAPRACRGGRARAAVPRVARASSATSMTCVGGAALAGRRGRRRGATSRARHAGEVDARPAGPRPRARRRVVDLHAAHARARARRAAARARSPRAREPDHSVPVTTVPAPWIVKTRSTCRTRPPVARAARPGSRAADTVERRAHRVDAPRRCGPSRARSATPPAAARAASRRGARRVGEVGLRDRHDARASRRAPRSTAACSRVWGITPSSAATTIRYRSIAGGAGDHRAHEALVAGHVDDRQRAAVGQRAAARSPARSRSRARFSSGSRSVSTPVRAATSAVLPWSMCPAVPSVSGVPAHGARRRTAARDRGGLVVGQRARVEQQAARP